MSFIEMDDLQDVLKSVWCPHFVCRYYECPALLPYKLKVLKARLRRKYRQAERRA